MQCPISSLVYPVGHGFAIFVDSLISMQLPLPSLPKPVAQTSGIDYTTQFPSPSYLNPVGHIIGESPACDRGVFGIVIGMHSP